MSKQMLIYENAVPISSEKHRDWSVKTGPDLSFAKHVNAVPLAAVEFINAASEYTIIFTGKDDRIMPSAVMGVRDGENLYLDDQGAWQAKYVPAFIRRYPFVFSSSDDGKTFMLCIDESYSGCNQEGRGERLFDAEGNRTQYLEKVLEFLQQYQAQFQRTQAFCKKLVELELLEPMQAQVTFGSGEKINLAGFMAVSRDKLKALSGEQLAELAKSDILELIYVHLQSMRNFANMVQRVKGGDGDAAEKSDVAAETETAAEAPSS